MVDEDIILFMDPNTLPQLANAITNFNNLRAYAFSSLMQKLLLQEQWLR